MRDVFHYLKAKWMLWAFGVMAIALTLLIAYLGGQSMALAWYTAAILAFLLALLLYFDGRRYIGRLRLMRTVRAHLGALPEALPAPQDALEGAYQAVVRALAQGHQEASRALEAAQNENLSYYTLWVHQIKTPIAAMRLVLRENDSAEALVLRQELFKVERYAELALQYVKLREIANDLVIERCDLGRIVRESVKKYGLLFVYKGLSVEIAPLAGSVVSDAKWLGFILEQLLSNAVKYTNEGGVKVCMESGCLVIEDSGIGIRPEDLPRIFEKGYTGYNGRVDTRASGVGLYLTRQVADALAIRIDVRSQLGHGTRVALSFPDADTFRFRE